MPNLRLTLLWIALFLAMATAILFGIGISRAQERELRLRAASNLTAIGDLKVRQIQSWCQERIGDASVLLLDRDFIRKALEIADGQMDRGDLSAKLQVVKGIYNYEDIVLIDSKGRIKWSASGITRIVAEEELRAAALSAKAGKPVLTDFYRYPMSRHIHSSVVAFMQDQTGESSASLILLTSATEFLYPLIQSWPVPSASAETLLVERLGDQVLFLNEPRFRKGSALDFLLPLSRVETPAVQAVTGRKGVYEGSDYRGIPCISFLAKVPETPWFIVSKMDVAEVFRPTRSQASLFVAFIGALVALALSIGLIVFLRSRRSQAEMSNLRLRRDLQECVIASETRYHRMIEGVTDYAILSLDTSGRVATWNIGAQRIYGYEASEILGEHFSCFYTDEERASGMPGEVLRKAEAEGRAPDEGWRVRKGGSRFWSLDNVTPIIDGYGRLHGYTVIARDLTEHILAEDRLRRMTAFYQLQSKASQIIVNATDEAELFGRIAMACVEYGHFELAWIGLPDEAARKMLVAAAEGPCRAYVDGLDISMDRDQETGQGPSNIAFQERRPVILQDWNVEPSVAPWKSRAAEHGLR